MKLAAPPWTRCDEEYARAEIPKRIANPQAPLQLNSLTGTYATSAYLAALKKSSKDLETLSKDIESFSQKLKSDEKLASLIGELR